MKRLMTRLLATMPAAAMLLAASAVRAEDFRASVSTEIEALEFLGGSPLSADERTQATNAFLSASRADPADLAKGVANARQLLRIAHTGSTSGRANLRELWLQSMFLNDGVPALHSVLLEEREVVGAHNPVVVADTARKVLITAWTVDSLAAGGRLVAQALGVPPPGAGATQRLTQALPAADEPGMEKFMQATQHIGRDASYVPSFTQMLANDPKRTQSFRQTLLSIKDPAGRDIYLADLAAVGGEHAYQSASSGGGRGGPMAAMMRGQAMKMGERAFNPRCFADRGNGDNFSYCSGLY